MWKESKSSDIGVILTSTLNQKLMTLMDAIEDPDGDSGSFDPLIAPLDVHIAHFTLTSLLGFET